jgi:hypothetical protein
VPGSGNGGLKPECGNLAVTGRILEGDLDLDCDVDVTDAQLIAAEYGAFFGSLLYSKWYDLEPALPTSTSTSRTCRRSSAASAAPARRRCPPSRLWGSRAADARGDPGRGAVT